MAEGVTGYPQNLPVFERFGYPVFLVATADELIDGHFVDRPHLRPILDAVVLVVPAWTGASALERAFRANG
jgi:hypothetical protein